MQRSSVIFFTGNGFLVNFNALMYSREDNIINLKNIIFN